MSEKKLVRGTRGSALIMALLVILVLTAVGIGLSYMTSVEDKMSGNAQREKAGFYAAEVGLRIGETLLKQSMGSTAIVTKLLTNNPAAGTEGSPGKIQPPGGGFLAVGLVNGGKTWLDQPVQMPSGVRDQATYSLYVRNDREDLSGDANTDKNLVVNLISVGVVRNVDSSGKITKSNTTITRVLEEQISAVRVGSGGGSQYLGTGGGTSSSSY